MTGDRNERIRKRAHAIWESEGHPQGSHQRHWEQATAEIDAQDSVAAGAESKATTSSVEKSGAGAALAEHSKDAKAPARSRKPAAPKKKKT